MRVTLPVENSTAKRIDFGTFQWGIETSLHFFTLNLRQNEVYTFENIYKNIEIENVSLRHATNL